MITRLELGFVLACAGFPACQGSHGDCGSYVDGESLFLQDSNNYSFHGGMDISSAPVAEMQDILVDWSGLSVDMVGHDLDPSVDILTLELVLFRYLTQEQVEQGLEDDDLNQSDVALFASTETNGSTSAYLSELNVLAYSFDPETYLQQDYGTWLLLLTDDLDYGVGTRMALFLEPVVAESNTRVEVGNDSMVLDVEAIITDLEKVELPQDEPEVTVDWTALEYDSRGNDLVMSDIDQLTVAHFANLTLEEIQASFLDIELLADQMWSAGIESGSSLRLSALGNDSGSFTGVDSSGTWLLSLNCTTCSNPAPLFLTVLEPCSSETDKE